MITIHRNQGLLIYLRLIVIADYQYDDNYNYSQNYH